MLARAAVLWALAAARAGHATCARGRLVPTLLLAGYPASGTTSLCYDMQAHLPFVRGVGTSCSVSEVYMMSPERFRGIHSISHAVGVVLERLVGEL